QVSIKFSPANPTPGEEVTATAEPMYFGNSSSEDMYYTWYIKHTECPYDDGCDFDENGEVELEDYKIEAARIIANAGFEWEEEAYNSDTDDDGYNSSYGGDDQKEVGKEKHCFFHDNEKGKEYEFRDCDHLFPNAPGKETGDGSFEQSEEEFWHTNPNDPDTSDFGANDEAVVLGLGQTSFTWTYQEGDNVGVAIEGISYEPTSYEDASYKVMWALSKNKCDVIDDAFRDLAEDGEETVEVSPSTWPSCPSGCSFTRTVTKTSTTYDQAEYSSYRVASTQTETKTEEIQIHAQTSSTSGSASATGGDTPSANVTITTEFSEAPEAPENETCYAIDGIASDSGITDRSCCPSGSDACSVLSTRTETTNPEKELNMSQDDKDKNLFKMTLEDFNKCLEDNFVDPTEGGGEYDKIDVSLSYDPKNPINDPDGNNSDQLTIYSSATNADDAEFLYYQWELYSTDEESAPSDSDGWEELSKSDLTDVSSMMGLGADELSLTLSLPEDTTYLKAKLTVSEDSYNGTKKGNDEIVIPLIENSFRIQVFQADVSDSLSLSTTGEEKCFTDGVADPICEVAKNQIFGVKVEDSDLDSFSWSIDNEDLSLDYSSSSGDTANPVYFPVLKEIGEDFVLALTATNKDTGEKVNLSRTFEVVTPEMKISPESESVNKVLLGYYIDTDDVEWPDYSETDFQALQGGTASLSADFVGFEPTDYSEVNWYLDGVLSGTGKDFSFEIDKDSGQSYSVSASYLFSIDNNTAKALDEFWDSPESAFYDKTISATIDMEVSDSYENFAKKKNQRLMASLIAGVPSYLGFLFRILLTTALMIFTAKIVFMLSLKKESASE
ncbi:MAG: hypothetical protein ACOYS2_03420, partial [Patescibacteria group bacterium]